MKKQLHATLLAVLMSSQLAGCFTPLILGGAVASAILINSDRRTPGAQVEDEGIEMRALSRLRDAIGDRAHINVTSYNRQVLLTGEVPDKKDKATAEEIVSKIENVKSVVNDLAVLGNTSLAMRTTDTLTTSRIKAALIDHKEVYANAFKVVTERGVVYLMGRVTQREADQVTEIVRGQKNVIKIVRLFEYITEEELKALLPAPAPKDDAPQGTPVMSGSGQPILSHPASSK